MRTRPSGNGLGVELLETDANETTLKANESIAVVAQNVSLHAVPPGQTTEEFDPDLISQTA